MSRKMGTSEEYTALLAGRLDIEVTKVENGYILKVCEDAPLVFQNRKELVEYILAILSTNILMEDNG